jgi:DsbC/DsbD-like thiol-disulfide interchange protein
MLHPLVRANHLILKAIFALVVAASSGGGAEAATSSPWTEAPKTKARLVAGRAEGARAGLFAFIEITLEPGWKTYWRTPGDAGGLPPAFDWSKSSNLARAEVLYPAPQRFVDRSGTTIGYHDGLVLPVEITPERAGEAVPLVVGLQYGICKDVCIPVEAELALTVDPGEVGLASEEALAALARVPRPQDSLKPEDPALVGTEAVLTGDAPRIRIKARFPGGATSAAAFLEAQDGLFLPVPEVVETGADGSVTFEAKLGSDVDVAALKGKTVTVTLVGTTGESVATFTAE